jgi:hypothetical protein
VRIEDSLQLAAGSFNGKPLVKMEGVNTYSAGTMIQLLENISRQTGGLKGALIVSLIISRLGEERIGSAKAKDDP